MNIVYGAPKRKGVNINESEREETITDSFAILKERKCNKRKCIVYLGSMFTNNESMKPILKGECVDLQDISNDKITCRERKWRRVTQS